MQPRRVLSLARRLVSQIRRDHRSVALIFVVPIVVMGLLGYILRIEPGPLQLGIVVEDEGFALPAGGRILASEALLDVLQDRENLQVREVSREDAELLLREGTLDVVLVLPDGLTRGILQGTGARLEIVLEGSNPAQAGAILPVLTTSVGQGLPSGPPAQGSALPAPALEFETRYIYGGEEYDFLDSFAPAYIAFFAFFFVFLLTGVSFLRERTQGTMERLLSTPVTRAEIVLGYMIGFGLFALVQSAVILLFTIYVLRIHHVGNLALVFLVEAILTVGAVNLGIFVSTYARTELQVVQFIPVVIVPQVLLSGLLIPVADLPNFLKAIAGLLPLTYANRAMTDVMIRGFGLAEVAADLGVLLLFALGALAVSALTLRRQFV